MLPYYLRDKLFLYLIITGTPSQLDLGNYSDNRKSVDLFIHLIIICVFYGIIPSYGNRNSR